MVWKNAIITMMIILVIIVQIKILVMVGKHNFAAGYANILEAEIVTSVTQWIFKREEILYENRR